MKSLFSITLLSLLAGCGLTRGEPVSAMAPTAPMLRAPVDDSASTDRSSVTPDQEARPAGSEDAHLAGASPARVEMGGALAQEDAAAKASEDEWRFIIRPYAWLPRISGTAIVNGTGGRTKVTQGQVWRNLASAGLINLAAAKGDMVYRLDAIHFALADDTKIKGIPAGKITGRLELDLIELDAGVRVMDEKDENLDLYVGLRYIYIYGRINPKNVGVKGQSGSLDWVDPIVGAVYRRNLSDDWTMLFMADYGGFGIGSASETTYQLTTLAEYKVGERWSFGTGYRYLMIDHSSGNGANKNEQHLRFSGPVLGAAYRF